MSGFAEWQLAPAIIAGLEMLGWTAESPLVRDVVPAVTRGTNVVAVIPPAPAWGIPAVAGLTVPSDRPGPVLLLVPAAQVGEWSIAIGALSDTHPLRIEVIRQAAGRVVADADVVIATPEAAFERHSRSSLKPERFRAIVFAWPEQWNAADAVAALLQDLPRDAQRVVLTASRQHVEGSDGVVERYARKAVVVAPGFDALPLAGSVRTVATSWSARPATIASVLDAIEAAQVTIWTADSRDHALIRRTLGALASGTQLVTRTVPTSGMVVCYDMPTPAELVELTGAGEVILLVPPGTDAYLAAIAPDRRPLTLNSAAASLAERDAKLRGHLVRAIDSREHGAALYALAPLFEQYDAQLVAATLFGLWQKSAANAETAATAARQPAAPVVVATAATAKLWIGAGKKDDATVGDFVAVLVKEAGMARDRIGRIELRDTYALVEVPAVDAEVLVRRVTGLTIRKRKVVARIDGLPEAPPPSRKASPAPPRRRPPPR